MLEFVLVTVTSILFMVDPMGAVPAFLIMTRDDSPAKRRDLARRAAVAATLTLLLFAVCGGLILRMFGVGLPAFRIAGGIVMLFVSLDMLRARRTTQEGPGEVAEGTIKEDIAITPLAIPMLAGPAALSTVTVAMNHADALWKMVVVIAAICLTGLISFVVLRLAELLSAWMGKTGIHVISRVLGLVLLAIAVQFVLDGLQQAGFSPLRPPDASSQSRVWGSDPEVRSTATFFEDRSLELCAALSYPSRVVEYPTAAKRFGRGQGSSPNVQGDKRWTAGGLWFSASC
jgi:multiple antibiotic resistance protein